MWGAERSGGEIQCGGVAGDRGVLRGGSRGESAEASRRKEGGTVAAGRGGTVRQRDRSTSGHHGPSVWQLGCCIVVRGSALIAGRVSMLRDDGGLYMGKEKGTSGK